MKRAKPAGGQRRATGEADAGASVEDRLLAAQQAATAAQREELIAEVILEHLPLARRIAARYRGRGEPLEDLMQVASMALVQAVRRYRPGLGECFEAYAVPTITGELRRCFRDQGWAVRPPRRVQELRPKLAQAMEALTQQLSRRPTVAELADYLGVPAADVRETQLASSNYHQLSLDAPCGVGQIPLAETVVAQDDPFEQVLRRAAARPILDQLEGRDRRILLLRYLHGWTQQHIAEDIGVTQMQVSRLLTRLQTQLRQLAASS